MADEQEIKELKEELHKLESRIEKMNAASRRQRPDWMNFIIAFLIVIVLMLIGMGVIQNFSN